MEFSMMEGPVIHGSTSIEKEPGNRPGDESGATGGLKMRRNEVSPLSDLMVNDMSTVARKAHQCKIVATRTA